MKRRSLKSTDALLVGRLRILDVDFPRIRPHLGLDVWCPYCHRDHNHGWPDEDFRSDTVDHRVSHCAAGPLIGSGYHIGLDPAAKDHNRSVVRALRESIARWESRQSRLVAPIAR